MQSHAENAFYRYKRIIGGRLRAKNDDAQKLEAAIGCAILNRMFEMGEPLSYAVGYNCLTGEECAHVFDSSSKASRPRFFWVLNKAIACKANAEATCTGRF